MNFKVLLKAAKFNLYLNSTPEECFPQFFLLQMTPKSPTIPPLSNIPIR
uniref:Uncharacterized protein n=1 Tax=Echinococcus granulosus TaxID=6210 RepID=U6FRE3_ECHGR|nr:hypothetical protein EgrG_002069900 [Echinococcus granulosus]